MILYLFVFFVVFLVFVVIGNMLFGCLVYMFFIFMRLLVNVCEMIFGKGINYDELEVINCFFGLFFMFFYFFGMIVFMMNFFVVILNDFFIDVREILEENLIEDSEMFNFIGEYVKVMLREILKELGGSGGKSVKYVIYEEKFVLYSKEVKEWDFFLY